MESLLEKKKADQLTSDEIAELDAIGGLDRIFTNLNLRGDPRHSASLAVGGNGATFRGSTPRKVAKIQVRA